jgi:hypothetical protein
MTEVNRSKLYIDGQSNPIGVNNVLMEYTTVSQMGSKLNMATFFKTAASDAAPSYDAVTAALEVVSSFRTSGAGGLRLDFVLSAQQWATELATLNDGVEPSPAYDSVDSYFRLVLAVSRATFLSLLARLAGGTGSATYNAALGQTQIAGDAELQSFKSIVSEDTLFASANADALFARVLGPQAPSSGSSLLVMNAYARCVVPVLHMYFLIKKRSDLLKKADVTNARLCDLALKTLPLGMLRYVGENFLSDVGGFGVQLMNSLPNQSQAADRVRTWTTDLIAVMQDIQGSIDRMGANLPRGHIAGSAKTKHDAVVSDSMTIVELQEWIGTQQKRLQVANAAAEAARGGSKSLSDVALVSKLLFGSTVAITVLALLTRSHGAVVATSTTAGAVAFALLIVAGLKS